MLIISPCTSPNLTTIYIILYVINGHKDERNMLNSNMKDVKDSSYHKATPLNNFTIEPSVYSVTNN
jgi:hypothetical protein